MKLFEWLAGLLILIPFSVDQRLSIELGQYTLRPQYLGTALWLGLWIRRTSVKTVLKSLKSPENLFFAGLGISGLVAVLINAPETRRGMFFLIWTIGTLLMVPAVARNIYERFRKTALIALVTYYAIQALIIIVDATICIPTQGKWSIGRIMVYKHLYPLLLCRPSAFYQEPGYFAATAALVIVLIKIHKSDLVRYVGAYWTSLINLVLRLGLILSLSRLGWLLFFVISAFDLREYFRSPRTGAVLVPKKSIAVAIALLIGLATLYGGPIYNYLGRPVSSTDGSIDARKRSLSMALEVFREHRFIGVGPGSAGRAYFGHRAGELPESERQTFLTSPLSQSLYGELLSEWGLIGSVLFAVGLGYLLRNISGRPRLETIIHLGLIYTSTQTLPRYDLWFLVGLLTTSRALIKSDNDAEKL